MNMEKYQLASVLEEPIISEKSTAAAEKNRQFVFKVRVQASKKQIKSAVEEMFSVKVESVNIMNVKGKRKALGRSIGYRSDWKKAYVKLRSGYDIEFSVA